MLPLACELTVIVWPLPMEPESTACSWFPVNEQIHQPSTLTAAPDTLRIVTVSADLFNPTIRIGALGAPLVARLQFGDTVGGGGGGGGGGGVVGV